MDREFLILLIFFNYFFYPKSPVSLFKLDKNNSFGYNIYILTNFQCFHTQGRNQNKCVFFSSQKYALSSYFFLECKRTVHSFTKKRRFWGYCGPRPYRLILGSCQSGSSFNLYWWDLVFLHVLVNVSALAINFPLSDFFSKTWKLFSMMSLFLFSFKHSTWKDCYYKDLPT